MYKEGETSSPEVCHEGIILPQHLCSYEREIEVGKWQIACGQAQVWEVTQKSNDEEED